MLGCWFRWTEEEEPISLFKRKERAAYKKRSWCVSERGGEREKSGVEVRERREVKNDQSKGREEKRMKEFWRYEKG